MHFRAFWLCRIFCSGIIFASYESTDDAQIDGHVNSVSARVSGHVAKLNVEDNQYVRKGHCAGRDRSGGLSSCSRAGAGRIRRCPGASRSCWHQCSLDQCEYFQPSQRVRRQESPMRRLELPPLGNNSRLRNLKSRRPKRIIPKAQNDLVRYKQLIDKQEISQQQYDQAVANAQVSRRDRRKQRRQCRRRRGTDPASPEQAAAGERRLANGRHRSADHAFHDRALYRHRPTRSRKRPSLTRLNSICSTRELPLR